MNEWEDIIEVPLPLPFELKIVKSYVIRGTDGVTLIDTGLKTEESIRAWMQCQKRYKWGWKDVRQIVLTHYHPDHYGLAGTLQQWTGASVLMSKQDWDQAQLFFGHDSDMPEMMAAFFRDHGLVDELTNKIPQLLRGYASWVDPHPEPTYISAGDILFFGQNEYQVYHTPGHADGHLSFFNAARGWLLGGDFLLPRITPNISLWPGCNPNPLNTYFETLENMKSLPVKTVFPSHGSVFHTYNERIGQLWQHHQKRLGLIEEYLQENGSTTAYQVCLHLFGENLSMHNLRFALSETLVHLEYLRLTGRIASEKRASIFYYV